MGTLTLKDYILDKTGVKNIKESIESVDIQKAKNIIAEKEKADKLKQIEIDKIKNIKTKEIIIQEIRKSQKINVLEGKIEWKNTIEKQSWIKFMNNNLNIILPFHYIVQYDIANIEVLYIQDRIARIKLRNCRNNFQTIVALNTENIKQNTDKEWFAVDFNNKDVVEIIKIAEQDVKQNIESNNEIYKKSEENLRIFIDGLLIQFDIQADYINE